MRSAVSSGRRLFLDPDVTAADNDAQPHSRRWYDLYHGYCKLIGDAINEPRRSLIRRIATMQVVLEQREQEFITSGKQTRDQTDEYRGLTSSHALLLKKLELIGVKKEETGGMSALEYARQRSNSHSDDEEEDD